MIIADEITKPYWVEVDENNYKVQKEVTSKEGKTRIDTEGYFSSVSSAIYFIAKLKVKENNPIHPITIKQYVKELNEIKTTFLKQLD